LNPAFIDESSPRVTVRGTQLEITPAGYCQ
jgi:hypothetical protein